MPEENEHNENVELASASTTADRSELYTRFPAQLSKTLMTVQDYRAMVRYLNNQQLEVLKFHCKWCKDMIVALKRDQPTPVYTIFLSGPGGVGKRPYNKASPLRNNETT